MEATRINTSSDVISSTMTAELRNLEESSEVREKKSVKLFMDRIAVYLFLAPTVIGMILFTIYPILEGFRVSFYKSNGTIETFVGLSNYEYLLQNEVFHQSILNTFYITFFQLIVSIPLAFVIAIGINSMKFGQNFLKACFFIPYVTPAVAAGALFLFVLHPSGILNQFLGILVLTQ